MHYPVRIAATAVLAIVLLSLKPALADSASYSWSGCYAGLHAGALWGKVAHAIDTAPPHYTRQVAFSSPAAGAHAGCNHQTGRLVFGIEGDVNWSSMSKEVLVFSGDGLAHYWRDELDRHATLRGRLGATRDRWHLYATAGISFSNLRMSFDVYDGGLLAAELERKASLGFVAGAGLEYAFRPGWIGRLEYLYHDFPDRILHVDSPAEIFRANNPHFHVVRVGITRKFGPQP